MGMVHSQWGYVPTEIHEQLLAAKTIDERQKILYEYSNGVKLSQPVDTEDGDDYKTPFTLHHVALTCDPTLFTSEFQKHIQPLLDTLNSLNGLVRGEAFTMTLEDKIENNEVKLILEFETE